MKTDKQKIVSEFRELLEKYSVIGLLDMHKMPAKQLLSIRTRLKKEGAIIKMTKKTLIKLALENSTKEGLKNIADHIKGQPALIFSDANPFKLYRFLQENKSPAMAKPGDTTPKDIIIPAGPTQFPAGPIIGEFQRMKVQTTVEDGKIAVKKDVKVASAGDKLSKEVVEFISKFGIEPMEVGLDMVAAWDNGTIFAKNVMAVSVDEYMEKIKTCYIHSLNLAVAVEYPCRESVEIMIRKCFTNAKAVAIDTEIYDSGIINEILKNAEAKARSLKNLVKS